MELFCGLVFPLLLPPPANFSADALGNKFNNKPNINFYTLIFVYEQFYKKTRLIFSKFKNNPAIAK